MPMSTEIGPVELPLSGQHWPFSNAFGAGPYSDPADTTRKVVISMICSGQTGSHIDDLQIVAMTSTDSGATWSVVYGPMIGGYTHFSTNTPAQLAHGFQFGSKIYIPNLYTLDYIGLYSFDLSTFTFAAVNTAILQVTNIPEPFVAWYVIGINQDGLCVLGSNATSTQAGAILIDVFTGSLIDFNFNITDPDNPSPLASDWNVLFVPYASGVSTNTQDTLAVTIQLQFNPFQRIRTFTWARGTISATPVFGLATESLGPDSFNNTSLDDIFGAIDTSSFIQLMLDPTANSLLQITSWANVGVDTWTTTVVPPINGPGSNQTRTADGYFWSCTFGSTGTIEYMIVASAGGIIAAVFSYDHSSDPIPFEFFAGGIGTQRVVNGRLEVATGFSNGVDYPPDMNTAGGARMWYWRTTPLQLVYRSGCRYYATS